jgi:AcrR family transcriptional regulator
MMSLTEASGKRSRGRPLVRPVDETRQLITTVAMTEFVANGFSGASMNEVARRAAASKRTVYRLFPTKADLFRAVVRDAVLPLSEAMIQEIDEPSALRPALERIMFEYGRLTLPADIIAMQNLAIAESARFLDLAAAFYVAIDATQIAIERFIQHQCDRGHLDFDDVRLAAGLLRDKMIMGPTRALMFNCRAVPEAEEIAHRANVCVRLLMEGCNRAGAAS